MFLLFLMVLGTAGVKAQVRIGGNAAPNASAVLDLNADDTNSGNKGLALPRVALTSNTMLLPGVTQNLTGMMVYNTITTGGVGVGTIGIYVWTGAQWNKANLPTVQAADSGLILRFNGSNWVPASLWSNNTPMLTSTTAAPIPVTWTKTVDFTYTSTMRYLGGTVAYFSVPAATQDAVCVVYNIGAFATSGLGTVTVYIASVWPENYLIVVKCYDPSA